MLKCSTRRDRYYVRWVGVSKHKRATNEILIQY